MQLQLDPHYMIPTSPAPSVIVLSQNCGQDPPRDVGLTTPNGLSFHALKIRNAGSRAERYCEGSSEAHAPLGWPAPYSELALGRPPPRHDLTI